MIKVCGIDPSTTTGITLLDERGRVLTAREVEGIGKVDPARMASLIDEIGAYMTDVELVAIEGFAYGAKGQGVSFQYGLGHGIRMMLYRRGIPFIEVAPSALKKFAGAKGNASKPEVQAAAKAKFNFEHPSNNITDAYVLARMALEEWRKRQQ